MAQGSAKGKGKGHAESGFPDLHLKMSKKIAQLTKVIYHLNTRNEDHELAMRRTRAAHTQELDATVRDASQKIASLQKELDKRLQQDGGLESQLAAQRAQHTQEREEALAEFAEHRDRAAARIEGLQADHARQVARLQAGIDEAKRGFTARVESFDKALREAPFQYVAGGGAFAQIDMWQGGRIIG